MKITIVGATGGVGQHLLQACDAAGHDVTAVVRDPRRLLIPIETVVVDLREPDSASLRRAVEGADAVLSTLGPSSAADAGVARTGTCAILESMVACGVRRIVVISAAPVGTVPTPARPHPPRADPGDDAIVRYFLAPIIKRVFRRQYADLAAMEEILRESALDWTILRPPRLTDGEGRGTYRTALNRNLSGGRSIARADLALAMLETIARPETIRQSLGVASGRQA